MDRETKKIPDNVTHYAQLKNGDYLGHWDLPVDGKKVKVTIAGTELENVFNPGSRKKEWCTVASLKDKKKRLVLNLTNMRAIASWHGDNPRGWEGKDIELFRTITSLKGETVECIRVAVNPKKKSAEATATATKSAE